MTFKILCIDGGGMRGVLAAQLLKLIEAELVRLTGKRLHQYFDLIAGTSSGSIIAANLILGKSAAQVLDLFIHNGRRIFPYWGTWGYFSPQRLPLIFRHGLSAPKFAHTGLAAVLREHLGQRSLSDFERQTPKLLIPTYDTMLRHPVIFKTWESAWYSKIRLWEAVLCSASAPTFFPSYFLPVGGYSGSFIDGGVAANNPTTCAITSALRLGYTLKDLRVLSIGTGESATGYPYKETQHWGLSQWAARILDVLMDGPQDVMEQTAQQIVTLGDRYPNHYLRLQPKLSNLFLDHVLDEELRQELSLALKGKRPQVREDIDDASPENIAVLKTLAQGYFKNQRLRIPVSYTETTNTTITEAFEVWVSSSVTSPRDGFAMEEWS
ncbi:patatin-like phospholipase family protein [Spirulina sp. CCNP1310]|uniref:patatin-like phospholipase family protein n=1 Tax=Spirulina sp. CCNP1310 TaxID=3110249 RepID=UPI002B20A9B2|nr:patatin-like phospholipase family protein [Spirulina sp. CCNP1310]MEA5421143.1 patatin-like phospholipase family protein [Spirulina sp. CCNP1310]